ncbi:rhodanese-like domain-containing protein [Rhodocaloribacter sp.]
MTRRIIPFLFLSILFLGTSCRSGANSDAQAPETGTTEAPVVVREVSQEEVLQLRETPREDVLLLDVRTPAEFAQGHVPGAMNISHTDLPARLDELAPYKDKEIIVYCRSGHRAGIAADILKKNGFTNLAHLEGDMMGWMAKGLPMEQAEEAGQH